MTLHIHRGFHRIGVVLAAPLLLAALALAGHETWLQRAVQDPFAGFADAPLDAAHPWVNDPIVRPGADPYAGIGTPLPDGTGSTFRQRANFIPSALLACLAALFYAAARAVGWVLAGFLGPTGNQP